MKIPGLGDDALGPGMTVRAPGAWRGTACFVGAGKRRGEILRLLGQRQQPGTSVLQLLGDDVDDLLMALDAAMNENEPGADHGLGCRGPLRRL